MATPSPLILLLLFCLLLLSVALLFSVVLMTAYRVRKKLMSRLDLTVELSSGNESPISLYDRIIKRIAEHAGEPLDYDEFPQIPSSEPDTFYQPGARDIFEPIEHDPQDKSWEIIAGAIYAVRRGRLTDWRILERNLRRVDVRSHLSIILSSIDYKGLNARTQHLFREVALKSADYDAVKWGIIISGFNADATQLEELLPLARHAEFTLYIGRELQRRLKEQTRYRTLVRELLPAVYDWGLLQMLSIIHEDFTLFDSREVQRDMLIYGTRNSAGVRGEIVTIFTERMDLRPHLLAAAGDEELALALLDLLELMLHEVPGTITTLAHGEGVLESYMQLLETLPATIESLQALRTICIAMANEEIPWPGRIELMEKSRMLFFTRLSPDILGNAIGDGRYRRTVMLIINELEIKSLLPVVLEDFHLHPDLFNIELLGSMGDVSHLQALFEALPSPAEIEQRSNTPHDISMTEELHEESIPYAAIIQHLGKLGTREAIERIHAAAADFHPWVRASAMAALGDLQRWTLDPHSKDLVRQLLDDPIELVHNAAERTAIYHNLNASIAGKLATQEIEMSLN